MNSTKPVSTRLRSLLPPFCHERCTVRRDGPIAEHGTFVLYIPCNALRAHENPALDAARAAGMYKHCSGGGGVIRTGQYILLYNK